MYICREIFTIKAQNYHDILLLDPVQKTVDSTSWYIVLNTSSSLSHFPLSNLLDTAWLRSSSQL